MTEGDNVYAWGGGRKEGWSGGKKENRGIEEAMRGKRGKEEKKKAGDGATGFR